MDAELNNSIAVDTMNAGFVSNSHFDLRCANFFYKWGLVATNFSNKPQVALAHERRRDRVNAVAPIRRVFSWSFDPSYPSNPRDEEGDVP